MACARLGRIARGWRLDSGWWMNCGRRSGNPQLRRHVELRSLEVAAARYHAIRMRVSCAVEDRRRGE